MGNYLRTRKKINGNAMFRIGVEITQSLVCFVVFQWVLVFFNRNVGISVIHWCFVSIYLETNIFQPLRWKKNEIFIPGFLSTYPCCYYVPIKWKGKFIRFYTRLVRPELFYRTRCYSTKKQNINKISVAEIGR